MAFLELRAVTKTYADGTHAVKGIDLAAERGEFVVLLGPSGCGKTTTLRMVAGLELPTGGTIELDGNDVTQLPPSARDVGFVFQFYALYPHLTVAQNIAFPLACAGRSRAEQQEAVAAVSRQLGLDELLARRPRQLSGGDQQRVGLARAMVRRPAIWLMDEPLGTLDSDRRLAMCEFLREQQLAAKITTIYVTHDQEEAMRLADRIVVMRDGRIEQAGSPLAVYDDPATLFVAHFVGSPGMNFLEGEIVVADGRASFTPTGTGLRLPLAAGEGGLPRAGQVTLGIRPEFVAPVAAGTRGALAGEVVVDEYLGTSRCLHVKCATGTLVARVAPDGAPQVGATVALAIDPARVRLFDPVGGGRLA